MTSRQPAVRLSQRRLLGVFALFICHVLTFGNGKLFAIPAKADHRRPQQSARAVAATLSEVPVSNAQLSQEDETRLRMNTGLPSNNFYAVTTEADLAELLDKVAKTGQLLVVDYYAPWCRACQKLLRYVQKIARDERFSNVEFASVDFERAGDLCRSRSVDKLPTMEIFRGQDLKRRWSGANTKRFLERLEDEMEAVPEEAVTS
ncbi:unnamed protein product [Effrenium voratum]|nr:unnamed protein product [Effrenium voratum]|eukprot:CAMPEP_0181483156 /NCGR_PEP_ID=MMETSP1110-20121109/45265_1 /TAXON_ID=174948 /ORGANISM="Symbiodinium sp., Strain CCMP421" /LENGTH=203 /DNA_ID=CAMNT_0023608837 /DNA_START=47 /DNA_END=658 /DNA_ORIENTATION=+